MEWWLIAGFLIFLAGLVIVTLQAVLNPLEKDDKSKKSKKPTGS